MKKLIYMWILLLMIYVVSAFPPASTEIYGQAFTSNLNATVGSTIDVRDQAGTTCGSFIVQSPVNLV